MDAFYGSGDSITFADPSTLIGCSNGQEPSELIEYSVTTAITPVPGGKVSGLLTGGQTTQITFNGGWIFANDGQTVSAKTFGLVGTYDDSIIATFTNAAAVPDPDGADVWFLRTADDRVAALLDFDRATFQPASDDFARPGDGRLGPRKCDRARPVVPDRFRLQDLFEGLRDDRSELKPNRRRPGFDAHPHLERQRVIRVNRQIGR